MSTIITTPFSFGIKTLKSIAPAMSKKETRYYLCGAFLEVKDGKATLTATDGHRLVTTTLDEWNISGGDCAVIIPAQAINQAIKLKGDKISIVIDRNGPFIEVGVVNVSFVPVDGTFPDWRRVIPTKAEQQIKFNKKYLLDLLKCVQGDFVTIDIVDSSAPALVTEGDTRFVLMPARL